jgi:hypothetical protein
MKRAAFAALVLYLTLPSIVDGQAPQKKLKPPCAASLSACPDQGCGTQFDPNLNERKNITTNNKTPAARAIAWIKKLDDPENFKEGETREELTALGETDMVTVVAYALVVRPELGGESCNCYLHTPEGTDNHIVLVSRTTVDKYPLTNNSQTAKIRSKSREKESITAEFTPRVRLSHSNFTLDFVQPMIDNAAEQALLVRVTGQLLFDSEHFVRFPLLRATNWEIHPVFKFEVCESGTCKANSDSGWMSVDEM